MFELIPSAWSTIDGATIPCLLAAFENVRGYSLVLGLGGLAGGILLFINHKRQIDAVLASDANQRTRAFEIRKFRRRSIVSAMIASVGCMMAATLLGP